MLARTNTRGPVTYSWYQQASCQPFPEVECLPIKGLKSCLGVRVVRSPGSGHTPDSDLDAPGCHSVAITIPFVFHFSGVSGAAAARRRSTVGMNAPACPRRCRLDGASGRSRRRHPMTGALGIRTRAPCPCRRTCARSLECVRFGNPAGPVSALTPAGMRRAPRRLCRHGRTARIE